jgi:UDP-N-acetylmuramoyl-tripeptide--D-alanyl-D-alanine ligase
MSKAYVSLSPSDLRQLITGQVINGNNRPVQFVCTDSRTCEPASLFVALEGAHVDGHEYLRDAVDNGAVAAMISADWARGNGGVVERLVAQTGTSFFLVSNPLAGLQSMATEHIRRTDEPFTIGITGSNGKTTTKELLGNILKLSGSAYVSRGNLNSEIGLPLSALELTNDHRFGVFELAMNHPGEMRDLARVLRPELALITNIGTAHIGILGSIDAIAEEKKQIFSQFTGRETAFIYESEPYFESLRDGVRGEVLSYGERSTPGYAGYRDNGIRGSILSWYDHEIHLPLPGAFNVRNALAAISVAVHLGIGETEIVEGIQGVETLFGRSEVREGAVTILQDCYNANPDSVREAVALVSQLSWTKGRKVVVLGDMKELGAQSEELHEAILREVLGSRVDGVFLLGERFSQAVSRVPRDPRIRVSAELDELRRRLTEWLRAGDLVLIKGSRSMEMEHLTPHLEALE